MMEQDERKEKTEITKDEQSTLLKSFRFVFLTLILHHVCIFFFNPFHMGRFSLASILSLIIILFFLLMAYAIIRRKLAADNGLLAGFTIVILTIGPQEISKLLQADSTAEYASELAFKQNLLIACIIILSTHMSWKLKALFFAILNIYGGLSLQLHKNFLEFDKLYYTSLIIQSFILCASVYESRREGGPIIRLQECSFQKMNFEQILKGFLASSIIIYKDEEILFFNEATKNMLDVSSECELKRLLSTIKFIRKITFDDFNSFSQKPEKTSVTPRFSLEDLLKDWTNDLANDDLQESQGKFMNFEGEMFNPESSNPPKSLFIQVGTCSWEEKQSLMLIINDMTSIKMHSKHLDEFKESMLAKVSHNLRTPLNGILGTLEVLMAEDSSNSEKLQLVYTSAKLLLSIVNDIIDFSKISRGRFKLNPELTNLDSLLLEVKELFALHAEKKRLSLVIENRIHNKEFILDRARLKQILINIVGNAVKFTDEEGRIWIKVLEQPPDARSRVLDIKKKRLDWENIEKSNPNLKLLFEIHDTGPGIKASDIDSLFNIVKIVNRIKHVAVLEQKEPGFGLPISQSLVALMNPIEDDDKIHVESELGKGSKFFFPILAELPQADSANKVSETPVHKTIHFNTNKSIMPSLIITNSATEEEELINHKRRPLRALIVDDDQINLLVASNFLKSKESEFEFQTAANGKQALDKVKAAAGEGLFFDVFLMDCNMPIMDGYEASRALKAMMKGKIIPPAPIIAITANFGNADKEKCFLNGMDHFLTKPLTKDQLFSKIYEAMNFV